MLTVIYMNFSLAISDSNITLTKGLVIIYSLVGREFWRITRFLSGGQRGIGLPRQRMTAEDYRELNVSELEMTSEGWGS